MLYDNAQLISLMARVVSHTGNKLFRLRIEETVDWLLRDMLTDGDAFAASYDADSEGIEGKFYVWQEREIDELLDGDTAILFKQGLRHLRPRQLGRNQHPQPPQVPRPARRRHRDPPRRGPRHPLRGPQIPHPARLGRQGTGRLGTASPSRRWPPAGLHLDRPDWIAAAETAFTGTLGHLWRDGTLYHAYRAGKTQNHATAEDFANLVTAAIDLYQATAEAKYIDKAEELTAAMIEHHWDAEGRRVLLLVCCRRQPHRPLQVWPR